MGSRRHRGGVVSRDRVEALRSDDGEGNQQWVLAARRQQFGQPRQMSYGGAEFLDESEADRLIESLEREGCHARRLPHEPIATNGETGDALISIYEVGDDLVADTNGDPVWEQSDEWEDLDPDLRANAERNRASHP